MVQGGIIKMTNKEIIQKISYVDIAVAVEELGELIKPLQKLARLKLKDKTLRISDDEIINQIKEEIKKHFRELVFETIISRNIRLSEAPSYGLPAIMYDADSKGAQNYLALAQELLRKNS